MAIPKQIFSRFIRFIGLFIIISTCTLALLFSITQGNLGIDIGKDFLTAFSSFEDRFFDWRYKQWIDEKKDKLDKNIVLAEIDDESLMILGRWPWSRTRWSDFINIMKDAGAKVLAFDIIFSEPEVACNKQSPDEILSASIKDFQSIPGNKIILPFLTTDDNGSYFKETPISLFEMVVDSKSKENFKSFHVEDATYPISTLTDPGVSLGFIDSISDYDGVFRKYSLVKYIDETIYVPSMGLSAAIMFKNPKLSIEVSSPHEGYLIIDKAKVQLQEDGEGRIRYMGGKTYYPRVSLKDILNPNADKKSLKDLFSNKIVYIGSSATGAHDLRHTPIDSQLPGVYTHMNVTSSVLGNYFYKSRDDSLLYSFIFLFSGILILILIQQYLKNALLDIITLVLALSGIYYLDKFYLIPEGYEIRLAFSYFCFIGIYSWNTLLNFSEANKEKKQIKGTFSRYVAPAIVNQMLSEPDKLVLGGEKKNITCIFSDVRDFTSISEKLTPTELSQCLNIYMSKMTNILFETYGTLDKYIGDAIVGYWGAPLELKNHAYHAVRGSVQMIEALPAINEQFKSQGFPQFNVGIGLNSGECSVGNMGSDSIFSYTALGDNMNLGSRLESLCKYYGVQINISEFTLTAIPEDKKSEFKFRSLDIVRVKGKEIPVRIYEVLHRFHPMYDDPETLKNYEFAYSQYLMKNFQEAKKIFESILEKYPKDKPSLLLLEQSINFLDNPPEEGWSGVTIHKEK
jgi:adenylate cyclase